LDHIKTLLILMLMKAGASQKEIAKGLGIDQGNFSRMYPTGKVKGFNDDK